jgi:hypothetical protein
VYVYRNEKKKKNKRHAHYYVGEKTQSPITIYVPDE